MQNDKIKWIIMGVILIMIVINQQEKMDNNSQLASASKSVISVQSGFQKETKFVPTLLFATNADYNCDDCSCSTSYTYCTLKPKYPSDDPGFAEWCNSKCGNGNTGTQCSSGYTYVGDGKCCPNSFSYYCSNNNLCYVESNCGQGILGEVRCLASPDPTIKNYLQRKEIVHSVAECSRCIGNNEGCGGETHAACPNSCLCDVYVWDGNEIFHELNNQFFLKDFPYCDSCSGNLCVRNNRCQIGEIRCADTTHYYACENVKPNYFANSFNDFTKTLQSCPGNTVCSAGKCEIDISCPTLKLNSLSSITAWSGNPISTNKNNAINLISNWASSC